MKILFFFIILGLILADVEEDSILLKSDIEQVWFRPSWVAWFELREERAWNRYVLVVHFKKAVSDLMISIGVDLHGNSRDTMEEAVKQLMTKQHLFLSVP